ncbi:MAG: DUF3616 domain-containing protein [Cyanobacteria bacterium]|nr:DUF3616 domain-containing protein [Cyanobacteriota bacterium]
MPAHPAGSSTPEATPAPQARRRLGQAGWAAVITVLTLLGFGASSVVAQAAESPVSLVSHKGLCNASAGLRFGEGMFVVADNENAAPTLLHLYKAGQGGPELAVGRIAKEAVAQVADGSLEMDLEGAARLGPLVYWIGSHSAGEGSGAAGAPRPNRQRLFATRLGLESGDKGKGVAVTVEPVGRPYQTLLADLEADPRYAPFGLDQAAKRPGKAKDGLNIEGLAATPNGQLLIGFRNPLPRGKALVAPLTNPGAVLAGEAARFGDPVLLELGGLGIRSLEMVNGSLLIVAGPSGPGNPKNGPAIPSALYRWNGQFESAPELLRLFGSELGKSLFNPEALFVQGDSLVLLSDDGKLAIDGKRCENLPRPKQRFRELRITPVP